MKRTLAAILALLLLLTGCGAPEAAPDTADEADETPRQSAAEEVLPDEAQTDGEEQFYNLISDDDRCGVILFVDGEAPGYNNYADGEQTRILNNCLVRVVVTFRLDDTWSLIYAENMAESCNSYCWVRSDVLKPYDPASMEDKLTYPVHVQPDTKLADAVHGREYPATNGNYWVRRKDGAFFIEMEGGVSCPVEYEDIIFPRVTGSGIIWK